MLRILRRTPWTDPPPQGAPDGDPIVDLFAELDELRATVYRQTLTLRSHDARVARERAAAQADEHRRLLVAVRGLAASITGDAAATPEEHACAARFEAALRRLEPEPPPALT